MEKEYKGLSSADAVARLVEYGKNVLVPQKKKSFIKKVFEVLTEPMFVLLIIAAAIYFVLGEPRDGAIMLVFVLAMIAVDVFQEWKTDKTLNALKELSAPRVKVVRDGQEIEVPGETLVPGDAMIIEEGAKISADGRIVRANDLCVDESSLTGEAEGVWKTEQNDEDTTEYWRKDYVYAGTLVTQGSALVEVVKTGRLTEYGKIGIDIAEAPERPTPLEKQTSKLVGVCAVFALALLVAVSLITYFNLSGLDTKSRIIDSILAGVTLAMALIPEEFPVILTVFLSMGAWRLAKKSSLVRRLPAVETLGAVSVLCVDKTGTITVNKMTVVDTFSADGDLKSLLSVTGRACEKDAYDPMEQAMLAYCDKKGIGRDSLFSDKLVYEYPFTNELKMMGHVWQTDDGFQLCAKGSPERILPLCDLADDLRSEVQGRIDEMSSIGLRVIAVAKSLQAAATDFPATLQCCKLTLSGVIGLADPPRDTVREDIARCLRAGIRVVMITGDNGITASAIAKQVGMPDADTSITGTQIEQMTDAELEKCVQTCNVFSRVVPKHKMRIVNAFKANGEVVAMTGDGVNDAPALKHADIGIAMGKRGSEVSREAADLVLLDDNFSTIVDTVRDGRRIYRNIKNAIGYVFAIHIPIALASLIGPLLGISPDAQMLLPLHVVLLELLIDPTCSIVLERQPAERDVMDVPPRSVKDGLLSGGVLVRGLVQGLAVFAAAFGVYLAMGPEVDSYTARSMALTVLVFANLFLVQENSSNRDLIFVSVKKLIKDKVMWAVNILAVSILLIALYTPVNEYLKLSPLSAARFFASAGIAAISVLWFEVVKIVRHIVSYVKNKKGQCK